MHDPTSSPVPPAAGVDALAEQLLGAVAQGRQITPFSSRQPAFDLAVGYAVAAAVRARRIARGEQPAGRKIGFTNRTIWAEYNVWAPIWGDVYDSTCQLLDGPAARCPLTGPMGPLLEQKIEPEIVFCLAAPPRPEMDDTALLGAIAWVAHGFELVQSVFPGWRFAPADTVAAFGMHGRLLVGPRHHLAGLTESQRAAWANSLANFEIEISRDGELQDAGHASHVLGGPLAALRHLVQWLAEHREQPPLAAGELVSTGTLTRALPIAAGQRWQTRLRGVELPGLSLDLA